jgi:alcohol dehydrogenase
MICNFSLRIPDWVHFGSGSLAKLPSELHRLGAGKVLIITDAGVKAAGLLDRITILLDDFKIHYEVFDKVEAEPSLDILSNAVDVAQKGNFSVLVGLGGGSSMDTTKMVAALLKNEGQMHDYFGVDKIPLRGIPTVMIPTTAGTGSEVSRMAVFTDNKENLKKVVSAQNILTWSAIIDPDLTLSMPMTVTAATGIDAFIHAMEAYIAVNANPVTDILALESMSIIANSLGSAYAGRNKDARVNMSYGAFLGGIVLNNAGAGAIHALAYPLGAEYHLSHGSSMTPILRETMRAISVSQLNKYKLMAQAIGISVEKLSLFDAADAAISGIVKLAEMVNLPVSLNDVNADKNKVKEWAAMAYKEQRLLGNTPMPLNENDIEQIYIKSFD